MRDARKIDSIDFFEHPSFFVHNKVKGRLTFLPNCPNQFFDIYSLWGRILAGCRKSACAVDPPEYSGADRILLPLSFLGKILRPGAPLHYFVLISRLSGCEVFLLWSKQMVISASRLGIIA
jgi:hypothetical protein